MDAVARAVDAVHCADAIRVVMPGCVCPVFDCFDHRVEAAGGEFVQ
jgi:hypothetical protein